MPPYVNDSLVVPPQWFADPMANGMLGRGSVAKKQNEQSRNELASMRYHNRRQMTSGSRFPHEWLKSLGPSLKMDMIAEFLCWLWEPEPTDYHKETVQQVGLDLLETFHVCDFALLVAVGFLLRLKLVFDRAGIHTRDCSAQLFTVALLTAVKFLQDVPPSNSDWADVSHFERRRLNQMEFELLEALDFNVYASMADVNAALEEIVEHRSEVENARMSAQMAARHQASSWYAHAHKPAAAATNVLLEPFADYEAWSDPAMGCSASYGSRSQSPLAAVPHQTEYSDDHFSLFHHALMAPTVPLGPEARDTYGYGPVPLSSNARHCFTGGYGDVHFPAPSGPRLHADLEYAGYSVTPPYSQSAHHSFGPPVYDWWMHSDSLFATATF